MSDVSPKVAPPARPRLVAAMARRRQTILDAAVELFRERGYLGTTVDDIAARAGLTKRTLYHHMGSKERILEEIHTNFIAVGLARWQSAVDEGGSATQTLTRMVREHIDIVTEYQPSIAVFFEEAKHLSSSERRPIFDQRRRYEASLRDVLERGIREGEFNPDIDVQLATMLIIGGLTQIYTWYDPKSKSSRETIAQLCVKIALDGIQSAA